MTELLNLRRVLAAQNVDDLLRAERESTGLLTAEDTGHQLSRGLGTIPLLRWRQAIVAVTARLARLAEIIEQSHATAIGRFAQAKNRIEFRRKYPLVFLGGFGLIDHPTLLDHISQAVNHPRVRGLSVAACS